jgi:hypothetical protein
MAQKGIKIIMKKILLITLPLLILGLIILRPNSSFAPENEITEVEDSLPAESVEPGLYFSPEVTLQGEPVWVKVRGYEMNTVESLTFNGRPLNLFTHEGVVSALIGIDLQFRPGVYPITVSLSNGERVSKNLIVSAREVPTAPLGIPESLGGNTPESERQLVSTLRQEAAIINAIPRRAQRYWEGDFIFPVLEPIVITDIYGYSRLTGATLISHKGTDFRAPTGTPIYAMNHGVVTFSERMRNYGNTIVIDHGQGLQTFYMHLSEMDVELGDSVRRGETIGKSGATGYSTGPHLHLTVRINGISIDPLKFMELFGESKEYTFKD